MIIEILTLIGMLLIIAVVLRLIAVMVKDIRDRNEK